MGRGGRSVATWVATWVAAALVAWTSLPAAADDAVRGAIDAIDAGRRVSALADDALEGREAGSRGGRAAGAYVVEELRALGLEPAGDGGTYFQPFDGMRNILAILPGRDPVRAGEMVVVGAHYDHVGYGTAATSYGPLGVIHNGADDNASGVAGLLEIAEALVRTNPRPRRPVLLALWDGEEKGLLGSRHFLGRRPESLRGKRAVFSVNLDMIGRLRGDRVEVFGARSAAGLRRLLVDANRSVGLELDFDWDIVDDSDHHPFLAASVPTLMLHTGLHDEYHRPADDAHLVNAEGIASVSRLALEAVVAVADHDGALPDFRDACRGEDNRLRDAIERPVPIDPAAPRPRWGMSTRGDPGDPAAPVVVRVVPGTPLAAAGLLPGDRILALDGVAVADHATLLRRMATAAARLTLQVERRGRTIELVATDGPRSETR